MSAFKRLWQESLTYHIVQQLVSAGFPKMQSVFYSSFLWSCWLWFDKNIINSRIVRYIFDPIYITNAWYESSFYRRGTHGLRRLSSITPRASLPWSVHYIGFFLAILLLIPHGIWTDIFLVFPFTLLIIFYFSHHLQYRTGSVFMLITLTLFIFWITLSLALPKRAAVLLFYLLLGIDFFFLVSFTVRTEEDLITIIRCIYVLLFILCALGFYQQLISHCAAFAVFQDNIVFGEIIVLLFPFAFICPITFASQKRRFLYLAILLLLVFTAVTASRSKAALIGFSAELLLMIIMIDWRYIPVLLFLAPAVTRTAVENISSMWNQPVTYGNFFTNAFYTFMNFWDNGFGISKSTILNLYKSTVPETLNEQVSIQIANLQVSPAYYSFMLDIGTLLLVLFLSYLLRLAHSTLTSVFTAQKRFKPYFTAGFAALIGISVSSMMESALFTPRTLLIYWGLFGLLRALRIIRFGITK